jgi:hypothetical protein
MQLENPYLYPVETTIICKPQDQIYLYYSIVSLRIVIEKHTNSRNKEKMKIVAVGSQAKLQT